MAQKNRRELKQELERKPAPIDLANLTEEERSGLLYSSWKYEGNPDLEELANMLHFGQMLAPYYYEITQERIRQHTKWGEQNHTAMHWLPILMEEVGELAKATLEPHFKSEGWQEQYSEVEAGNYTEARKELVQVAAVALAMLQSLDRNELAPPPTAKI